ncbi:hypothetical protein ACODT3_42505 [Streptomyces sp. 4.24]|uniref:hypothetical protein n=1 Tax=Streptomyces tritrimontium TaxID=3406573 RepID=UPI003BB52A9F
MTELRAGDGIQPPTGDFAAATTFATDGNDVAIDGGQLVRSSRSAPFSPTLACAEAAGVLLSPPDLVALIRRLRA